MGNSIYTCQLVTDLTHVQSNNVTITGLTCCHVFSSNICFCVLFFKKHDNIASSLHRTHYYYYLMTISCCSKLSDLRTCSRVIAFTGSESTCCFRGDAVCWQVLLFLGVKVCMRHVKRGRFELVMHSKFSSTLTIVTPLPHFILNNYFFGYKMYTM